MSGSPRRIAHFSDTFLPRRDGVVTSIRALVAEQRLTGHEALLVVPRHRGQPADEIGVAVPALTTPVADLRLALPMLRHLRAVLEWRPDVVHLHTPGLTGVLGLVAARRLGIPVVHSYHTDLRAYADAYRIPTALLWTCLFGYAAILRVGVGVPRHRLGVLDGFHTALLRDADAVIVPTESVLTRVALPLPRDRVFVVPTGVCPELTTPDAAAAFRSQRGIPAQAPLVLFVGRVHREKGVELLVHAFRRVLAEHPDARLVFVGAVYHDGWARKVVDSAGIGHRTVLAGQQPADVVAAAYAAADLLAFPSLTDTQGLVLQEAASAGLPSVMVDSTLHSTDAIAGSAALATPDPTSLGKVISALLADTTGRLAMGAAARLAAAPLSQASYGANVQAVYRTLDGQRPRRHR
jgi:glycosyltransferase involved in cell wall biosynthesis